MLEVCVDTFESAAAAVEGGAARIELCTALSEGGLTPTVGLLKTIKCHFTQTPVFAMLRPHGGTSYSYTDIHLDCIVKDMYSLRDHGVDGFVFGALTPDRSIDKRACAKVLKAAGGLPVTFHRAFDETRIEDVVANSRVIEELGFQRLLTSGCFNTADDGAYTIRSMIEAVDRLIVMPGSGINVTNAATILNRTGCKEFHSSARATSGKSLRDPPYRTDAEIVRRLVDIGKQTL